MAGQPTVRFRVHVAARPRGVISVAPGFAPGDEVDVVMTPEGPSSSSMGEDVRAAFAAEPEAAHFFDSLATFYRNNFARSIEAAKRPETRARRLAEMIDLLKQRQRER
jgi:uncharacterized protein YdeI (YjbR/CyaY-like superfamily)